MHVSHLFMLFVTLYPRLINKTLTNIGTSVQESHSQSINSSKTTTLVPALVKVLLISLGYNVIDNTNNYCDNIIIL